jgi:hypothetical protein
MSSRRQKSKSHEHAGSSVHSRNSPCHDSKPKRAQERRHFAALPPPAGARLHQQREQNEKGDYANDPCLYCDMLVE